VKLQDFLNKHGFTEDPFASTNAEEEDLLTDYFVRPPYFASVLGKPSQPRSTIVFAARGGGKTAQRRVLEEDSRGGDSGYLCVLYDSFPEIKTRAELQALDADTHLERVGLRLLMAILLDIEDNEQHADSLDDADRAFITEQSRVLESITQDELETVIRSLKSQRQLAGDWIRTHSGPIKVVIAGLLKKRGMELDPTAPWGAQFVTRTGNSPRTMLKRLVAIAQKLGFESVYVLIDKLDETQLTNTDPKLTADLIAPLLLDLPAMELPGMAYKVFIWDLSKARYDELGGRPDRIPEHRLTWTPAVLREMMSRRLAAYSNRRVSSLNVLADPAFPWDLDDLAAHLAYGSPRDMIRLCARLVDEHLNGISPSGRISSDEIWSAIRFFSEDICRERGAKYMPDLQRLETYRFTQSKVSNDYLRIKKQSVQAKVVEWRRTAMVEKVTEVQDSRRRPQHLYGVVDPRLAIALKPNEEVEDILAFFFLICPACTTMNISDEMEVICLSCQHDFTPKQAQSLLSGCERETD
jgi:hypothetical protein